MTSLCSIRVHFQIVPALFSCQTIWTSHGHLLIKSVDCFQIPSGFLIRTWVASLLPYYLYHMFICNVCFFLFSKSNIITGKSTFIHFSYRANIFFSWWEWSTAAWTLQPFRGIWDPFLVMTDDVTHYTTVTSDPSHNLPPLQAVLERRRVRVMYMCCGGESEISSHCVSWHVSVFASVMMSEETQEKENFRSIGSRNGLNRLLDGLPM